MGRDEGRHTLGKRRGRPGKILLISSPWHLSILWPMRICTMTCAALQGQALPVETRKYHFLWHVRLTSPISICTTTSAAMHGSCHESACIALLGALFPCQPCVAKFCSVAWVQTKRNKSLMGLNRRPKRTPQRRTYCLGTTACARPGSV